MRLLIKNVRTKERGEKKGDKRRGFCSYSPIPSYPATQLPSYLQQQFRAVKENAR